MSFRPRTRRFLVTAQDPATTTRERAQVRALERRQEARAALLRAVPPPRRPRTIIAHGEAFDVIWDGS